MTAMRQVVLMLLGCAPALVCVCTCALINKNFEDRSESNSASHHMLHIMAIMCILILFLILIMIIDPRA